jgi:hypothetical protein
MRPRNRTQALWGFILRIQGGTATCRRVGFTLVNAKTGKLGKQSDAPKFGFFVEPQYALDVLKLVAAQVEAGNTKLTIEKLRDPLDGRGNNRLLGSRLI